MIFCLQTLLDIQWKKKKHCNDKKKKKKKKRKGFNNFNNYEYLKELDDLREYKRITSQKIKKYESSIYSYKNQLRNVNKKKLDGGKINLKLINIFVNNICDIIEYLCSDINKSVLSVLPFIHTILNTSPIRDKKIYECSKLIHITLTQLNCKNVVNDKYEILREENEKDYDLRTHKLDDLEWLACETNDKGWLAISDRWETCPKDLKWLCVKRNNRSWILYRHIWENSSDDLKYIAILFDDKKWLHLYKIWKLIPLTLKFKAINSRDVNICKPSLSEIIFNDIYSNNIYSNNIYNNDIYNNDIYNDKKFVNINSYDSSSIKNNYRTSSMMGNYYLRYNNMNMYKNCMDKNILSSKLYENMQKREDSLEESLKYDLYKAQKKKKADDSNKDEHILKHTNTKKGVTQKGADNLNDKLLTSKEIEKDKKENESFKKFMISSDNCKNGIIHSIHEYKEDKEKQNDTDSRVVIQKGMSKSVLHEEREVIKKKEQDQKNEKDGKDDKRDILSHKQLDINIINNRLNSKFILKRSYKENFIKSMLFNKINVQQKVDTNNDNDNDNDNDNNNNNNNSDKYEEKNKSNEEKKKQVDKNDIPEYKISEINILKNEDIKTNKQKIQLLEKKESEKGKNKEIEKTMNNIQKKKLPSLKNLLKMKEEYYFKKFSKMIIKKSILEECVSSIKKKQNSKCIENFDDSSNDEFIDTKHGNSIKYDEKISKRTVPLVLNKLSKIKLNNTKKFPILIKKQNFKEHIINIKEKDAFKTNKKSTNNLYLENMQLKRNCDKHIFKTGMSNDIQDVVPKETLLMGEFFKSEDINEKEIEINKEQKDEDIKKEDQGMVTNYFTDLLNAFNFVNTPKEVGSFFDLKNKEDKILLDENLIRKNYASWENDKSDDEKEHSLEKTNNNRDVMKLNIEPMNSEMIMEGNNINDENIKKDNIIPNNSINLQENKLQYIKTLRSLTFNKFPIKNNLKGYTIKKELLTKIKKKNNEEKWISMENDESKLNQSKNQSNSYICKDPILHFYTNKNKSSFLKESSDSFMENNHSNILQKVLDSDLSNFNNMNKKKMTADEIAKHANASLYITVKRKASQSSLTNSSKIIPKIKEKPKLSF
ncbi:hypothetical protein PFAG_01723 [Plasmodium falciparum Santa Lucia]|uniref:Uncharacterized protein n=2 Tax=Plasmodium falciparum TaxID=5833 RepID=A0A0L7KF44_PLAFX|nr:hypothetical protein PFAG_01723 [Plasmodium falciparum Santa Lucia]KOB61514.1 hypothetical protein PFHG_03246 [Plasmodium falciparum HB3]